MKTLVLMLFLLCCSIGAMAEDVLMDVVRVIGSASQRDKEDGQMIKVVAVRGKDADYVLICNEGERGCTTPAGYATFLLLRAEDGPYVCENVKLQAAPSYSGFFCLRATYPQAKPR